MTMLLRRVSFASYAALLLSAALSVAAPPAFAETASPASVAAAVKATRDASGKDFDLEGALAASPKKDVAAYKTALDTAAEIRTQGKEGTIDAGRKLVKLAGDFNGAFRPEIAKQLKAMGDPAIPALIETKKDGSAELKHWATAQLEGMGKRLPGDAVQTKDNQVLAEVLHAYGAVHDVDAVPVILSFVSADRPAVRNAARDAILAVGQDANWKLREAYANVTSKPAPDGWTAAETAKELFAAYDRLRLQEVYGLLDSGLAAEKAGKLDEAIAAFDKVLARQPMLDRRAEMAPAYLAYAQKIEEDDREKARAALDQSRRLSDSRAKQIDAELAYLEGKDLLARGIADPTPFARALELDPTHAKAREELDRMDSRTTENATRVQAYGGGGAVLFLGVIAAILFGGRRRPRPARA